LRGWNSGTSVPLSGADRIGRGGLVVFVVVATLAGQREVFSRVGPPRLRGSMCSTEKA
jgi:hypothetical protein